MPTPAAVRPTSRAIWLCLLGLVPLLGSGCVSRVPTAETAAAPGRPSPPTEITFAYWALAPREVNTVNQLVAQFQQQDPSVKVRVVEVTDRYYDKLMTMFAAGTPPDTFVINYGRLGDFARKGLVRDLRPLTAGYRQLDRSQFVAAAYDSFEAVGATVGRPGLLALPRDWGPSNLLVFNKDAFDAAGVDYPTTEWTWQQFAEACRRLAKPGNPTKQYGAAVSLYPYAAAGWVFQNGGDFLSPDRHRSTLADGRVVGAVRFLKKLVAEGVVAPINARQDESLEQFSSGMVAMAFLTPYSLGGLRERREFRWGIAPPLTGSRRATGCIPTGIAISARSSHEAAAFRFIRFWVTTGARKVAEAGYCVPAWKPGLESPSLDKGFSPECAAVLRSAAACARPHPISPQVPYEVMLTQLKQAFELVFACGMDPAVALRAASDRINAEGRKGACAGRADDGDP